MYVGRADERETAALNDTALTIDDVQRVAVLDKEEFVEIVVVRDRQIFLKDLGLLHQHHRAVGRVIRFVIIQQIMFQGITSPRYGAVGQHGAYVVLLINVINLLMYLLYNIHDCKSTTILIIIPLI